MGDSVNEGKKVCFKTASEGVSRGPVLRIRFGASGFGISELLSFDILAFLIKPLAVSSIQPHFTLVGCL